MMLMHMVDFMLVMPLSPYFVNQLHIPIQLIGTIVGVYTLSAAFSSLLFSRIIDKFSRKRSIIFALFGLAVATALTASAWNEASLLFFRILAGMFGGPVASLATTLITENIAIENRGKAMGILMSSFSVSSAFALPIGVFIATHSHWRLTFLFIALLTILLVCFTTFNKFRLQQVFANDNNQPTMNLLKNKGVLLAYGMVMISTITLFALIPNLANFFVMNRGIALKDLSLLYFCGGIASLLSSLIAGWLIDKSGTIVVSIIGSILVASGLILQIHLNIIPVFLFYMLLMGGASFRMSSATTLISEIPEPSQRGTFMSLQNSLRNFMLAVGASMSGLFLTRSAGGIIHGMGIISCFTIFGTIMTPLMMIYIVKYLRQRGSAY